VVFAVACAWAILLAATPAFAGPIKVACIGEHSTHSDLYPPTNREAQPPGKQEYPAMLQTLLGPQYDVRNFGDCCASVLQNYTPAETHPYVNGSLPGRGPGYAESLAFLPDIVVIGSWGRHDWGLSKAAGEVFDLGTFEKDYDNLVQRYMALSSHPKIYVSLPIPILFGQGNVPDNGVTTSSVLPAIQAVAARYNLPVIDLYTAFLGRRDLFRMPPTDGEGEHIADGAGFQHIADTVYAALSGQGDGGSQDAAVGPDAGSDAGTLSSSDAASGDDTGASGSDAGAADDAGGQYPGMPGADGSSIQGGGGGMDAGAGGNSFSPSASSGSRGCACSTTGHDPAPVRTFIAGVAVLLVFVARRRKENPRASTSRLHL
jgi:MYXO-CTERM domain-containing protein